ncbi:hypothetical protein [Streptomyces yerevanensis]|uniref:hypothetical protein n=1 Tax=Streptomyces yerevanensis TaxID=66378 RepID=UPI000524BC18|nr:hypothetical protein [Streptomyces yerevanensis]
MADTREGGQDGNMCAELTPQVVNNVWSAPATGADRPTTGTETCLRLHITQRANSSAGGVRLPSQVPAPADGRPIPYRVHRLNQTP